MEQPLGAIWFSAQRPVNIQGIKPVILQLVDKPLYFLRLISFYLFAFVYQNYLQGPGSLVSRSFLCVSYRFYRKAIAFNLRLLEWCFLW